MKNLSLVFVALIALSPSTFAQKNDGTCPTFPCVVASASLTNQSEKITSTPLLTSATGGVFRVDAYISTTKTHNPGAYWQVFESWTDNIGARMGGFVNGIPDSGSSGTYVVQLSAGQTLSYGTRGQGGGSGGMTYDLNIVVEQLQ